MQLVLQRTVATERSLVHGKRPGPVFPLFRRSQKQALARVIEDRDIQRSDFIIDIVNVVHGEDHIFSHRRNMHFRFGFLQILRHLQHMLADARFILHPLRPACELRIDLGDTVLLHQCRRAGEEIGPQSQPVPVNRAAERRECRREVIKSRVRPRRIRILHRRGRIDITGVNLAVVF